jgi:hypothetical protein
MPPRESVTPERAVGDLDEAKLPYLMTGSLYHLLVLCNHFDTGVTDGKLHAQAMRMLPPELRERL